MPKSANTVEIEPAGQQPGRVGGSCSSWSATEARSAAL
jgi:hypothetical protein